MVSVRDGQCRIWSAGTNFKNVPLLKAYILTLGHHDQYGYSQFGRVKLKMVSVGDGQCRR